MPACLRCVAWLQVILRVDAIGGRLPITIRKRAEAALKVRRCLPALCCAGATASVHACMHGCMNG